MFLWCSLIELYMSFVCVCQEQCDVAYYKFYYNYYYAGVCVLIKNHCETTGGQQLLHLAASYRSLFTNVLQ